MKPALLLVAWLLLPCMAWAGAAHEHGAVRLDIVVEASTITLQLETPLDNLLGFERAPRNEAERKSVAALAAQLRAAEALFKIDAAAQCTLGRVELASAALQLGPPGPAAAEREHADLDASFTFNCKDGAKAGFIDITLFDAFRRMKRIEVQVAAPTGQFKRTLKAPAPRIVLGR